MPELKIYNLSNLMNLNKINSNTPLFILKFLNTLGFSYKLYKESHGRPQ